MVQPAFIFAIEIKKQGNYVDFIYSILYAIPFAKW